VKKLTAILMGLMVMAAIFAGCGSEGGKQEATPTPDAKAAPVEMKIGSLKGPTSMGLVYLMKQSEEGKAANDYSFTMYTTADELLPLITKGELDIAMVPANVASVLYNKTNGAISVIDVNTLGVLYIVSGDEGIKSLQDLKGKTIYMTGKGTVPEYVLSYLLKSNNLEYGKDVKVEFKSEPTEVASILAQDPSAIGLLPQPYATAAMLQNQQLKIVLDLTQQWNSIQGKGGSTLVTGVTVIRNEFLKENEAAVKTFLKEYKSSTDYVNTNVAEAAQLVVAKEIVAKAPIAEKAIPYCNITYMDGEDMKAALSGYLQVLFDQNPTSVGGKLPGEDFYYIP
jgi:NitT/TauT family transport system substrate-binding protein